MDPRPVEVTYTTAVQARLRHRSAKTTLDVYGRLFPDSDDKARTAVDAALARRADFQRTTEVIA